MKVFLDNSPLDVSGSSIAAALAAGCRVAEAGGRVVIEASLDGAPIPGDQLENPPTDECGGEVRMVTAEPRSLVAMTLLDVAEVLPGAQQEQRTAAEKIQTGDIEGAMTHLTGALAVWDQVRQVVDHSTRLLRLPVAQVALGGRPLAASAEQLGTHLAEVKRSISARDWTGLADVLAYDLDSQADAWKSMLIELAEFVRRPQPS